MGIQRASAAATPRAPTHDQLVLRIGVSLGDVVVQGNGLLGEGVNVAARLEAMAEPGGIAISADVMAQIRGKIELPLEDCGHKKLKEADTAIHVYMTRSKPGKLLGFLDIDDDAPKKPLITGGCLCGAVRYEIDAPAVSTGYCHCRICQKFTGSAMSAWTAFPVSAVRFVDAEPRYFASTPIAERGFCPTCGASLTYKLVRPRETAFLVVFTSSLDQPQDHAPTIHSGIESQLPWLDILDDLPRMQSGDSRVLQEAWSSVGLPDPKTWGSNVKPPQVF